MRARSPDETSLELLLDTVCNTFGAVMFITMLLAVIASLASESANVRPPDEKLQQELVEKEMELESKRDRLAQLNAAVSDNQAIVDRFASDESQSLSVATRQATTDFTRSLQQKEATLSAIVEVQQDSNSIAEELHQQSEALRKAKEEAAAAEAEFSAELAKRSKTAKLPVLRESIKDEAVYFLKYGRLYSVLTPDQQAQVNTKDCTETLQDGIRFIDPRPDSGLAIDGNQPDGEQVVQKIGALNGNRFHAVVVVWPDSFSQFQPVKNALVDMGVEYDARVMPESDDRIFWGRSAGASYVQ